MNLETDWSLAENTLVEHGDNAATSTLAPSSTDRLEARGAGGDGRDSCTVEISNTKDIRGTALRVAVESIGASVVGSWGVAAVALDGVGHDGRGEESDEESRELHVDCSNWNLNVLVCWRVCRDCRGEGVLA